MKKFKLMKLPPVKELEAKRVLKKATQAHRYLAELRAFSIYINLPLFKLFTGK